MAETESMNETETETEINTETKISTETETKIFRSLISIIAIISASFAPPTNIGDTKIGAATPSPPQLGQYVKNICLVVSATVPFKIVL